VSKVLSIGLCLPESNWGIIATGHWGEGGVALFHNGDFKVQLDLPPALLDSLAILMDQAIRSGSDGRSFNAGYVTMDELCRRLKRRAPIPSDRMYLDPSHVSHYMHRLRKMLAAVLMGWEPKEWESVSVNSPEYKLAKRLLHKHKFLGYRVSIAADRLALDMQEDSDEEVA